jgi:hypothetical protein
MGRFNPTRDEMFRYYRKTVQPPVGSNHHIVIKIIAHEDWHFDKHTLCWYYPLNLTSRAGYLGSERLGLMTLGTRKIDRG